MLVRCNSGVKRRVVACRIKTKAEVCVDDNEISISGALRADLTGLGARVSSYRLMCIAKTCRRRQSQPQHGVHPGDVG
jgi:hypothetical protein